MLLRYCFASLLLLASGSIGFAQADTERTGEPTRAAAVVVVTNTNDSGPGSLRQAIADAGNQGTVTFGPAFHESGVPKLITLTSGPLVVGSGRSIEGPGANLLTVSGNNTGRVFSNAAFSGGVSLSGITISGGAAGDNSGGAVYMPFGGTLRLDGVVVSGNTGRGAAVYNFAGSTIITNSTLAGNHTTAIYNDESSLTVTNTIISGNVGVGILSLGQLMIANSTITNNAAGGVYAYCCDLRVGSSIIAGNLNNATRPDIVVDGLVQGFSSLTSNGYNLIGNRGSLVFNGPGDQAGTATSLLDPQLGFLQNNGGPTLTHLPRPGSRAIDAGNSFGSAFDQRGTGFLRAVDLVRTNALGGDGTDIGSGELQAEPPPTFATISGKLRRPSGANLANTRINVLDQQGQRLATVTTSSFGEFSFPGLPVGQTYLLQAASKRYRFAMQPMFLDTNISDLNLIGLE